MDKVVLSSEIGGRIVTLRGEQVMLDRDLALLYEIETRTLNQAVKRNRERFPDDFMFQLTKQEFENWKSQIVISNSDTMGLRKLPYAFTEQGVYMLAEYDVGVHPCVYPLNMYKSKTLNTLSRGQIHRSAPTGDL